MESPFEHLQEVIGISVPILHLCFFSSILCYPQNLSLHTPFSDSRLCPVIALSSVAVLALASAGDLKSVTENWKANPKQLGFIITLISK